MQNTIKVLTLAFFISVISGFVLYRSGYFDASDTHLALQSSPNGGELNNSNIAQDSTHTPEILQHDDQPIMPNSKSGRAFDLEKYENAKRKEIFMQSTKSMTHPISIGETSKGEIKPPKGEFKNPYMHSSKSLILTDSKLIFDDWFAQKNRNAIQAKPELIPIDSSAIIHTPTSKADSTDRSLLSNEIKPSEEPAPEVEKPKGVSWGLIGLGVLGIFFVAIGSIVYFKKRSK